MAVYITENDNLLLHPLYGEKFQTTTVLIRAVMCEDPKKVEYFLKKKCDPNSPVSKKRIYPLMVASYVKDRRSRLAIFKTLLQHGADPALCDVEERNSVMYACALSRKKEVNLLIKNCEYDLNAVDIYGDTILHICARTGDSEVMGVILKEMQKLQKNISVQNKNYLTPLSLAVLKGNYTCAKLLHDAGAYPRLYDLQTQSNSVNSESSIGGDAILNKKAIFDALRVGLASSGHWSAEEMQFRDCKVKKRPSTTPVTRREVISGLLYGSGAVGDIDVCQSHRGIKKEDGEMIELKSAPHAEEFQLLPKRRIKSSCLHRMQSRALLTSSTATGSFTAESQSITKSNEPTASTVTTSLTTESQSRPKNDEPTATMTLTHESHSNTVSYKLPPPRYCATSTDCINAMLSSTTYRTRTSPSYRSPSTITIQPASEWLNYLTTYKQRTERYIESAKAAAAAQNAAKQKIFPLTHSSTPSSTSSSSSLQSILTRKKFVPRSTTSQSLMFRPFKFKAPDVCAV